MKSGKVSVSSRTGSQTSRSCLGLGPQRLVYIPALQHFYTMDVIHCSAFCDRLPIATTVGYKSKKSKVENLYSGSKRSRSLLNRLLHYSPCSLDPCHGCHIRRVDMKALARYQLVQGRCPTMRRPRIKPTICRSRVRHPNHYTTEPPLSTVETRCSEH